ncbi:universal stress protein UspA [Leuconostoc mesenteroides subsp. dextranicum]|jgi:nucleotide-binding universal stress UspA family protein|uniref:universal stress protein n=1 Tax=Leuconostoc mesenteroides TaxID=1245 RepID=UPI0006826E4B|nr:universal stress protein [Leuconostoc mesenteroides]KMY77763.1 universal stress protein UspA [Leuconostoc mesenteroides subsp. mesenteroides]KMY81368.1 universal stress protein UspA [Leuconostoc mesenteroides subsp. dextranicum]MBZ1502829.1 universal stress protein [Leuconostoc mesenteroides]MBZ1506634.1 universal stress protein [Leuconostoc mesenteroides]MCH3953274.1 universal stress protein [Leuconostoc mesenteroides]
MTANYHRILVPIDGSKESEAALTRAIELTLDAGDEGILSILNVIDTRAFQNVASFDDTMVEAVSDETRKSLEKYKAQAIEAGVKNVDYLIEYGSPKSLIAKDVPNEVNADLIVIGATGLNAVERLVIGSVTEFVTRSAKVDVLVVRG